MLNSATLRNDIKDYLSAKAKRERNIFVLGCVVAGLSVVMLVSSLTASVATPILYDGSVKDLLTIEGSLLTIDGILLKILHYCVTSVIMDPERCKLYKLSKILPKKRNGDCSDIEQMTHETIEKDSDKISPIMFGVLKNEVPSDTVIGRATQLEEDTFPKLRSDTRYRMSQRCDSSLEQEIDILRCYIEGKECQNLDFVNDVIDGVLAGVTNGKKLEREDDIRQSLRKKLIFFLELKIFLIEKSGFLGISDSTETLPSSLTISPKLLKESFLSENYGVLVGSTIDHLCDHALKELEKFDYVDSNLDSSIVVNRVDFLKSLAL